MVKEMVCEKKVAILTSGGDCAGLNAVIKGAAQMAIAKGLCACLITNGYAGHTVFRGGVAADADCILIPEIRVDFDVVYEHLKQVYTRRLRESDTRTATYIIVVTEGLHDYEGERTSDATVAVDAFGHKKLGGSGKYVRECLAKRIMGDPEMTDLFKTQGLFVAGMHERPDIRESAPMYLIRSGTSSALDVNFGRDLGAGAVVLLKNGVTGVTVTGLSDGIVHYAPVKAMIEQRLVNDQMVSFYECLGVCFGRKPAPYKEACRNIPRPWCYL
jgi:6-phosphofructokinase 1